MADQTFPIANDQTGERKQVTAKQFDEEFSQQGWRIADVGAFAAATAPEPVPAPEPTPAQKRMAEQGNRDAAAAHAAQYPDVKVGDADAKAYEDAKKQAGDQDKAIVAERAEVAKADAQPTRGKFDAARPYEPK